MVPPSPIKNSWPRRLPGDSCNKYPGQSPGAQACTTEPESSATSNSSFSHCPFVPARISSLSLACHQHTDRRRNWTQTNVAQCLSETWWGVDLAVRSSMEDILNLVLIVDPLSQRNGPKDCAASRSSLPKSIDNFGNLPIVILRRLFALAKCGVWDTECVACSCTTARLVIDVLLICASL